MKPQIKNGTATQEQPLPDTLALANLATQPRFTKLHDRAAVSAALALWREAQSLIEREGRQAKLCHEHYVAPIEKLRQPKKWPASFEVFLEYVVRGNKAQRDERFMEFLEGKIELNSLLLLPDESRAAALNRLLNDFATASYSQASWENLALEFRSFWKRRVSLKRSGSGKQGAATKARDKVRS
jgi:hypothetical protein